MISTSPALVIVELLHLLIEDFNLKSMKVKIWNLEILTRTRRYFHLILILNSFSHETFLIRPLIGLIGGRAEFRFPLL